MLYNQIIQIDTFYVDNVFGLSFIFFHKSPINFQSGLYSWALFGLINKDRKYGKLIFFGSTLVSPLSASGL